MQKVKDTLDPGTIIQDRYLIKNVLGTGGFSAVYLVQDQQAANESGEFVNLFALKQLLDQDRQERERFTFEGVVLTRLSHPSLPRIYRVFEDEATDRACILMDFVEGSNLEVRRKEQPHRRFELQRVLTMMEPIVDAIEYLHRQEPPIIHRDVKPSNIIMPKEGGRAVLVDFGIAKEYHPDSTTTAIRHCSPGYGAPEQYSIGTDLRTDVYGLGATFYALLTGVTPVDALRRATEMASKGSDPLAYMQKLVPAIPSHVADAVKRAMSIGSDHRFATVDEFWQALNGNPVAQDGANAVDMPPTPIKTPVRVTQQREPVLPMAEQKQLKAPRARKWGVLALLVCALLIVLSTPLGFLVSARLHQSGTSSARPTVVHTNTVVPAHPTLSPYPKVADAYHGTAYDLSTHVTTHITLEQIHQSDGDIRGTFLEPQMQSPFSGVLDTSRHIIFTVTATAGQPPLFFDGSMRGDGNLVGNYCAVDRQGQCTGSYGVWSIAPGA